MDQVLETIKRLTDASGVPGSEGDVRNVMRGELASLGTVTTDGLGSVIAEKVGDIAGPRVMIAGHLDEVGFMVNFITDEGFIKFLPLGGWWEQVMLAQRVVIKTSKGDVMGVIGSKPPHLLDADERGKPVKKDDMFIDIGVESKVEAEEAGVTPGDSIVPVCPFTVMTNPKYIMAKAVDNRLGCAAVVEVLRNLQGGSHPNRVFGVATVQEEVGLRGAQTSATLISPDVAIAVDVGIAGDTPGIDENKARSKMGKGPLIMLLDGSMISHPVLRQVVIETAKQEGIDIQLDALTGGGTDGGRVHTSGSGVPTIVIGFPTRYIHSHAALFHRDDFQNAVRLIAAVIRRLDRATVDRLRAY